MEIVSNVLKKYHAEAQGTLSLKIAIVFSAISASQRETIRLRQSPFIIELNSYVINSCALSDPIFCTFFRFTAL